MNKKKTLTAKIIVFPGGHVRASAIAGSRAAKAVRSSAVTPALFATAVSRITDHHSDGMLSRLSHLRTAQEPAPTSVAMASREGQSSIIDRNDVICESESTMHESLGRLVPKCKAIMSHDCGLLVGHNVQMDQDDEKIAETAWRAAFRERLKEIQGKRTQEDMADLLCISRDSWNKILNRGDAVPVRLLPKLAKIGARSLEWLIEGPKPQKVRKIPASTAGRRRA